LPTAALAAAVAVLLLTVPHRAAADNLASGTTSKLTNTAKPLEKSGDKPADGQLENYQDLILKAQNLTLQQDRLQTSQVLIRGIQRETRGSGAYKELVRALEELTTVFYTEKAQSLFATAQALIEAKPREAIEQLQEAIKTDDRNVTILNELARVHLRFDECEKADQSVKQAEDVNPFSAEIKLLRLQVLACQKNYDVLTVKLASHDPDLDPLEKFTRGLQIQDLMRHKDLRKAKTLLATWETQATEYPEVYYWQWQLSREANDPDHLPDRIAATKYLQMCQNLTPRKLQSLRFDVDLCKQKSTVDKFLKETATQNPMMAPTSPAQPAGESHR